MAENSNISWTTHTWNPWRGCTKISPGCTNCYAETMSHRNPAVLGEWGDKGTRVIAAESSWKQPLKWNRAAAHEFDLWKEGGGQGRVDMPKPERPRVFCASLADVFEDRPELVTPRVRLFHLISETQHLDWLLLTKRPENISRFHGGDGVPRSWPENMPPNVWLGVSVENQEHADKRIPVLLRTPAAVRFLSYEPALGPLDLVNNKGWFYGVSGYLTWTNNRGPADRHIDWVIAGGESGARRRPCQIEWFASLRAQCERHEVAFFMKQDMALRPGAQGRLPLELWNVKEFPTA